MSDLDRLADLLGLEPVYHDIWGNRRETSAATKRALVAAMGLNAATDADVAASLAAVERRGWSRPLPPVLVAGEGQRIELAAALPDGLGDATLRWTLTPEGGSAEGGTVTVRDLTVTGRATIDGAGYERRGLGGLLPVSLPIGYHRLEVALEMALEMGGEAGAPGAGTLAGATTLIVAPERCVTVEEVVPAGRTWGIGLQVYSLRSGRDWGMGDFGDLARFAGTAGRLGAGLVGLNPLHALFPADPHHIGPYSPSSRQFLNILYIDVAAVPELDGADDLQARIAAPAFRQALADARQAELIDYSAVAALKLPVLEALHARFHALPGDHPRKAAYAAFRQEMGAALERHALFDALHEHFFRADPSQWMWRSWPAAFQDPESAEVAAFAAEHAARVDFFAWAQFEADRQLGEAAARGRAAGLALGFYRDLAVAAHPGGGSAWADPSILVQGANVGAPPDQFNLNGQNWGLAPLSPLGLREAGYRPFIEMLRANMRHAGALRIDHVMALQHLFWIPEDGSDGAYVEYPFHELLRIVALESRRNRCVVIGEDLGTVPEGFRPALERAGILSYRVLYFERTPDGGFKRPGDYPAGSMATVSTHDLAPFKGFWTGRDLEWRTRLGLYPDDASRDKDRWDRGVDRWRLLQALSQEGLRPDSYPSDDGDQPFRTELAAAVHAYLARTPSRIVMVQIEDALCEDEQPNLPGTVDQHPNWRRRLTREVEQLDGDAELAQVIAPMAGGTAA
ncbi:4-alpha-glucanotransferase [Azospirillum picis]|uniref:4-alpha-glucanotransferase n=1 Tax=Azospirillum picis TaxID=488438 RepID=A0ABU0MM13_9PROT|nr:4-alpha-glucanotransferase [Azospirillum picis]MBP2300498.1 4-alpha-glucanotransferase [Azospirillum picis]MDQ0534467.1 4-alpha-glucanotransferase [Azospirillum picis]